MRYVVYGAGAIGGLIGAKLHAVGHEVVFIARGDHYTAMRKRGLHLLSPSDAQIVHVPAVRTPSDLTFSAGDCVILGMKTQDTESAVAALADVAPETVRIVCAQNGVENERIALRFFDRVYGMRVFLPADHLEPGVVQYYCEPVIGVLDVGRMPSGTDGFTKRFCDELTRAGFDAKPTASIMRWKYSKLISNLGNALEALFGNDVDTRNLLRDAVEEAKACFTAAGIEWADTEESRERNKALPEAKPIHGNDRPGGSTWQSVVRGSARTEVDYLNGEIVLLGRLHGVPTPVNLAIQEMLHELLLANAPAGSAVVNGMIGKVRELAATLGNRE